MANLTDHMYAGDARNPFSFGGAGDGLIRCKSEWGTSNLGAGDQHRLFKVLKDGYVNEFVLQSDALDSHATPTLTLDVGTQTDDDEFIAASTVGRAGGTEHTNTASTGTATEAGFPVSAGDYIIISVNAAAATAVAGNTFVSFRFTAETE